MTEIAGTVAVGAKDDDIVDIAILGAGPVGMALAIALAGGPYRVLLIDSRRRDAWQADPRALALSHGSRQLLERLGAWNAAAGTPIHSIHVSQRGGFGRTLIDAGDYGLPALGYVLRYRELAATLAARLEHSLLHDDCATGEITSDGEVARIMVNCDGAQRCLAARLVVHAEGTPGSECRAAEVRVYGYRQHAIIAEVQPTTAHAQRAWERFTADGPLALLPLGGDYSLVFTVPPERAAQLLKLDEASFLAALREQFGSRLDFVACGPRAGFPLALRFRHRLCGPRQVWIGNAAQSLHPVSGQGFNLGLRDAWELAERLLGNSRRDPGDAATLTAYARSRASDRGGSMAFTDGIVRLFSNDFAALRAFRGAGLQALDLFPPLRHFIARRMIWGARAWL